MREILTPETTLAFLGFCGVVITLLIKMPWPGSGSKQRYVLDDICKIQHSEINRRLKAIEDTLKEGFERLIQQHK